METSSNKDLWRLWPTNSLVESEVPLLIVKLLKKRDHSINQSLPKELTELANNVTEIISEKLFHPNIIHKSQDMVHVLLAPPYSLGVCKLVF